MKQIDLSKQTGEVFYKYIYPLLAEKFLFGSNYEFFAGLVSDQFILNATQWENILDQWEFKESILKP